jgi:glycosyltransferase involved in cell wall biosynthesis
MGMEIPVAGYNVGALAEILDGEECLGNNQRELVEAIIALLDNREKRIRIGVKNRNRALRYFSLEIMVKHYEQLYKELLSR